MAAPMNFGYAVGVDEKQAQCMRQKLESDEIWDRSRRLTRSSDKIVFIPILPPINFPHGWTLPSNKDGDFIAKSREIKAKTDVGETNVQFRTSLYGMSCFVCYMELPPSKTEKFVSPYQKMAQLTETCCRTLSLDCSDMVKELPTKWEMHGDLVLVPYGSFQSEAWKNLGSNFWDELVSALGGKRLARKGPGINPDGVRSSSSELIHGTDSWVTHVDNGIKYMYDVCHCMFSAGNITEKLRIGNLNCTGQTVVDLYAGIGYFTLPFLVHAGAKFVHACEWNPHAVEALCQTLTLNGVEDRCRIYQGDNREVCPKDVADRINLGLIPSSEDGWPVACQALKPAGGFMHIHGNVNSITHKCERLYQSEAKFCAQSTDGEEPDLKTDLTSNQCPCFERDSYSRFQNKKNDNESSSFREVHNTCVQTLPEQLFSRKSSWSHWAEEVRDKMKMLLEELKGSIWDVRIQHVEHVKSYAPHVDHIVVDLECRPR